MKNKENLIPILLFTLAIIIVLVIIGFTITAWVMYGNKPITEIPAWALWLMWKGGNK